MLQNEKQIDKNVVTGNLATSELLISLSQYSQKSVATEVSSVWSVNIQSTKEEDTTDKL